MRAEIYETITEINKLGVAILLVEQNANYALDVSERGYVLETGRVVLKGDSGELRNRSTAEKLEEAQQLFRDARFAEAWSLLQPSADEAPYDKATLTGKPHHAGDHDKIDM